MARHPHARFSAIARAYALASVTLLLAGCVTNGDFGRVRPSLVNDHVHDWMGPEVMGSVGKIPSAFELTDHERLLRDLAYPLIEPPYERQRWHSVLNEWGITRTWAKEHLVMGRTAYSWRLFGTSYRSANTRYNQLIDDIRNDIVRIPPFYSIAGRVGDLDRKREQSLPHVSALTADEKHNALARNRENALIVAWVCRSLMERVESYQFALERLVISTPADAALQGERSLTLLREKVLACYAPPPHLVPKALVVKG
jgi:hypothetical protein